MSPEVLRRDLRDRRLPALGLGLALAALAFFVLSVYAGLRETLDRLTEAFPAELLAFVGGEAPGGYVVGELYSLIAPLALVGYAVMTGASAFAGEEEQGTMGLLAAHPLTRRGILAAKAAGLVAALATAALLLCLGTVLAAEVYAIGLDAGGVVAACLHLLALSVMFGLLALGLGAATGRRDVAAAVTGVVAALAYLTDAMLPLAGLEGWARLSPWFYYSGSEPLVNGIAPVHALVLAALATAFFALGMSAVERRDLRG